MAKAGDERMLNGPYMDGLALHYYTVGAGACPTVRASAPPPSLMRGSGSRSSPRACSWTSWCASTATIMDKYDPKKKVAMIVDEWGTWYAVEPGTHPRFLYQQNSMRDAIVAATTFDIFNKHCDRVRMANIAQTVNVLQAMILTDKAQDAADAQLSRL